MFQQHELSSVVIERSRSVVLEAERVGREVLQQAIGVFSVSFLEVVVEDESGQFFVVVHQCDLNIGVIVQAPEARLGTLLRSVLINLVDIVNFADDARPDIVELAAFVLPFNPEHAVFVVDHGACLPRRSKRWSGALLKWIGRCWQVRQVRRISWQSGKCPGGQGRASCERHWSAIRTGLKASNLGRRMFGNVLFRLTRCATG